MNGVWVCMQREHFSEFPSTNIINWLKLEQENNYRVTPMIELFRTTQIAFFRFATPSGFQGRGGRRGRKSIRARVRARENPMKPFVRTSFLGTRPLCLTSPGRPFFCPDDRKPNLWLGRTGSPVKNWVWHDRDSNLGHSDCRWPPKPLNYRVFAAE